MIVFRREVFMGEKRRSFTREFKLEAVRLVTEGKHTVAEVAQSLDIRADMLRAWKRQVEGRPQLARKDIFRGHGKVSREEEELSKLRRDNELLRQERDFLKKAAAYFAKERP
jgi:transposase